MDDFSCGPACLATIAHLSGVGAEYDYDYFRGLLAPRPRVGSHPHDMINAARETLPLIGAGDGVYKGGLALGYIVYEDNTKIISPDEPEIDHYVVFLARKKDQVVYYDPYDNEVYSRSLSRMKWHSTYSWPGISRQMEHWAVTFETPKNLTFDFCAAAAVPHKRDKAVQSKIKHPRLVPA